MLRSLTLPFRRRLRASAVLLSGAFAAACGEREAPLPHVVLISLDTTRADHLGCYGSSTAKTPHLDQLASEGVLFRDVTAPAPTTLASHASLMTGLTPRSHGVPRNGFEIDGSNVMLAERLNEAGYRTAAFLGSFALDRHFGFDQGFDEFDRDFDLLLDGQTFDQNQRRAAGVTDAALGYLDRSAPDERHFLFLHYFDPHSPYDPPAPYGGAYVREGGPARADLGDLALSIASHHYRLGHPVLSQQQLFESGLTRELLARADGEPLPMDRDLAALYAGEVSYLDHHLGRLFDGLRERGILDDAVVVVTGDHGESFWEHADVWNHGLWVFDTTIRVPCIVRLPGGRRAGRVVRSPISTIDLVPTLLELLGLEPDGELEGRSLAGALEGRPLADAPIFSEATQPAGPAVEEGRGWVNEAKPKAVREGHWKYVVAPYLEVEQLFDLSSDPGEVQNLLADPSPEILTVRERLRAHLERWRAERRPRPSRFNPVADEMVEERLRELGYLGGSGSLRDD